MEDIVDQLINILFDETIDIGSREDAAMSLADHFQDDRALIALQKIGSDPGDEELLASFCGESIGEILVERGEFRWEFIEHLIPAAKRAVVGFINTCKPEWIKQYNLEEFLE